jgi:hypothetical protein
MERVTIYRAISAPVALVAGILSIIAAAWIVQRDLRGREFALSWLLVLALTLGTNTLFVWREARRGQRVLISPGMKMALTAAVPPVIPAAMITAWFFSTGYLAGQELLLVGAWMLFYGLALLATSVFAPRSLLLLGWAFVITAIALPLLTELMPREYTGVLPAYLMGISFGVYHLLYSAFTGLRSRDDEDTAPSAIDE